MRIAGDRQQMSSFDTQRQAVIHAVAQHVRAACYPGEAHVIVRGKRIPIEVTTIGRVTAGSQDLPRLRFDRVACRVVAARERGLSGTLPDGTSVIVTVTAPIRLPSKTAQGLDGAIRAILASRSTSRHDETMHGNQIGIRLVQTGLAEMTKVVGLVHNPERDPGTLMHVTEALIESIAVAARARASTRPGNECWLALDFEGDSPHVETYRQLCSQLPVASFSKIFAVFSRGQVETLFG